MVSALETLHTLEPVMIFRSLKFKTNPFNTYSVHLTVYKQGVYKQAVYKQVIYSKPAEFHFKFGRISLSLKLSNITWHIKKLPHNYTLTQLPARSTGGNFVGLDFELQLASELKRVSFEK